MLDFARRFFGHSRNGPVRGFSFDRPLVLLQSDDWARVGVRDQDGYELLRKYGIRLGQHPYDFYTLETAEDVIALRDTLKRHRDSTGRAACIVMNFLLANLDFPRMASTGFEEIHIKPITEGLPGGWRRAGLFEAYKQGTADGVFHPALHGLTHLCCRAAENALARSGERRELLKTLWKAETPYIYWRMPWVGYEYCNPERPHAGFLSADAQAGLIREATKTFTRFFSASPVTACAPGYRANHDTHAAWADCGIRVAQNGSGAPLPPHMNDLEILNLYRTIDFEPTQHDLPIEKYMQLANACFARGLPVIISVHSINFHSTLKDFRGPTLRALDGLLSALEDKYPNLLYVHDGDLCDIVTRGRFKATHGAVSVKVKQQQVADVHSMVGWGE